MSRMVKRCHACGETNVAGAFLCTSCGADISHVLSVAAAPPAETPAAPTQASPPSQDKICPQCQASSPSFALLCTQCGYAFENTAPETGDSPLISADAPPAGEPTLRESESGTPAPNRLEVIVNGKTFEVHDGDILGRQGTVAGKLFERYRTISRRHLQFHHTPTGWRITALPGVPNTTQLDGVEMARGTEIPLSGRHRLRLSSKLEIECRIVSS